MTFKDGTTTLGTGALSGGTAAYTTSTLAVGSHSMTASYAGDTNDNSSTSPVLTQTVNKASTTVTLTSSANPTAYGSSVTFTAAVTPLTATGTVTFLDGGSTLGTGTISGGSVTYRTSALAMGSHSMTASYGGDTNDAGSSSLALTQTVNKASTTVALTSSANPSAYGFAVTFTAAVTPSTATGTVTFLDGSSTLGTGTIRGGTATYSTSALTVASHSMMASYSGDTNNSGASSSALTQTVNKASTTVTLTSSTSPPSLTFAATVTPATATGTVTFLDGSATLGAGTLSGGSATFTASALAVGSHSMTASYDGDSNYSSGTSAMLSVEVIPPSIGASASPSPDAGGWNNANVTVSFSCTQGTYPMASCPEPVIVSTDGTSQQITGTVTDTAGNRATATSPPINLDKTPPTLSITSPTDGSVFSTPQLTVSGAVNDALSGTSGVTCNGVAAIISANAFSCEITLNPGVNPISVQATDAAGNQGSASITTTFVFGPKVTITVPTPLALFSSNPITVSGTIDDPNATVSVNGVAGTINGNEFTINGVPLREAKNLLTVTAVNTSGGVGSDTVTVYLDTTPPSVHIDTPTDGAIVTSQTVTVTGMVNDLVNGTVNQGQVTVSVNGAQGTVSNRSFQASNVLLVPGDNLITATAKDIAGNTNQHQIHVRLQAVVNQQKIMVLSGDGQTAPIGTLLPQPLVVQVVDSLGVPIPNRTLDFSVERSDGILLANPQQGRQITLQTDPSGQASVQLQLGTRVGVGNNVVSVASPGFVGEVMFSETSTVGSPATIHVVSGDMQKGQGGLTLPEPLQVIVTDSGGNPVPGVQVTYTVNKGGGSLEGNQTVAKTTDNDGKAAAVLTLALAEGINNNVVTADFAGDTNAAAGFTSSGVAGGIVTNTTVSGIVLDNANVPIPNATASIKDTNFSARTDAQGQFTIKNAPVGNIVLYVDGSTSSRPETFPTLSFQMATVSGIDNTLGGPIFLPALDTSNSQVVGGNQDVMLTMTGVPGVKYTVFANSVTFPDGTHIGRVTLSQVHADKVPMVPPNGSAPTLVATLQPAGVKFDPPIRMELPNTDGLAPGTVVELFSFHHDVEQFVTEGTARVSQDGSVVVSDPGFGLTVSGWHGSGPPVPPPPTCGSGCNNGNACQTGTCVGNNKCQFTNKPNGTPCQGGCGCTFGNCAPINSGPGTTVTQQFTFPQTLVGTIDASLKALKPLGITSSYSQPQLTATLTTDDCCKPSGGLGTTQSETISGNLGKFTLKGNIYPPGGAGSQSFKESIDFSLFTLDVSLSVSCCVSASGTAEISGQAGYRKNDCSTNTADQAGCYFAQVSIPIEFTLAASAQAVGSFTYSCDFGCTTTELSLEATLNAGKLSWTINVADLSYKVPNCNSGLNGGTLQAQDGKFIVGADIQGSWTRNGVTQQVKWTADFLSCTINLSGVDCKVTN
jgi:Big-like domain-containing protein/glucodextranase-like protein/carboxypeptidase family protein